LGGHWCVLPLRGSAFAIKNLGVQNVVTVGENISLDMDYIPSNPFDRKSATINLRAYIFNDNSVSPDGAHFPHIFKSRHSGTMRQNLCLTSGDGIAYRLQ
jgi:hypothetical protein